EIQDPANRRFGYAFANCTHCGPRFSIVESIPYDRAATTMRHFSLCDSCRREYQDPADRRFHAQPIACPDCGPRLWIEAEGLTFGSAEAIAEAAGRLAKGDILAIKGIGGFQLACDALNEAAVARLRDRKRRPSKPFALMALDIEGLRRHAFVSEAEAQWLRDPAAPIVLLEARGRPVAASVAPRQWALGWMLPTTPLHLLLLKAFGGPLVMTSGNLSGEPQAIHDDEARQKLQPFADAFLMHDRPIARRLDDSVVRIIAGQGRVQRRARGFAPETLPLPKALCDTPPVVAYGAFLKATICLTGGGQALLSHHLGDLDDALTAEEFIQADTDYRTLLDHRPEALACDLHPDYPSTAFAEDRAKRDNLPLFRIQHHHAHVAAAMVEAGWNPADGPVLGLVMDGLGWGTDGTVWGGEFLLCDYGGFERLASLKPVALPGGTAAQLEPWRNQLAQLDAAGLSAEADRMLDGRPLAPLRAAMAKGLNAPLTSSAGRLFDAVAAATGLAPDRQSFEGEAAMALETAARTPLDDARPYPFEFHGGTLDPAPLWQALIRDIRSGVPQALIAANFHVGFARALADTGRRLARSAGARAIALSGGCFQNATLLESCLERLSGVTVLVPSRVPVNDGGIALGQAAVAAYQRQKGLGPLR
ncbi:MAG: carbamoyltransferase HypF, partial [Rhodospirillales bacterium]